MHMHMHTWQVPVLVKSLTRNQENYADDETHCAYVCDNESVM
jgi:hypothetical protein